MGRGIVHPLAEEDTSAASLGNSWLADGAVFDAEHTIGDRTLPAPTVAAD